MTPEQEQLLTTAVITHEEKIDRLSQLMERVIDLIDATRQETTQLKRAVDYLLSQDGGSRG